MSLQRAKSLATLYEEVKAYDLVLVPDAPLASAINRRLDQPHFGTFATTPRRLAAGRREQAEDRLAFVDIIDNTAHDWKATAYAIGNVLQCWEHQGAVDAVLEYQTYADETTRDVVEEMAQLESTSRKLTETTLDGEQSIAVVGIEQFTNLERSVLPATYDAIDLFTDKPFDRPPFHIFDSSTAIVDTLLNTVTEENAKNVAVVLDGQSRYSSLVESAFEAADIPFYGGPGFIDDPDHRSFIQLLRVAYRGTETQVADIKPLLTRLGADGTVEHDEKHIGSLALPAVEWIREFCDTVDERTFGSALDTYEERIGRSLDGLRGELDQLALSERRITRSRVDDLGFYFDTYEVPLDRDNEGVLLADAKSSGYVDRPVVFYLGLDEEWTHSAPKRPWVDTQAQFERYIRQFQLLLQSGDEQYYLVQDTAGGQPVTPCLYFSELLDERFDRFSDLDSVSHRVSIDAGQDGFETEPMAVEAETVDTISQSSLNTYVNSPRDYFFSRLVASPDKDHFREGNLFHDFAEFYVNHPDRVRETDIEEIVEVMLADVRPFYAATDRTLRRRKYRIGIEMIMEFLDAQPPTAGEFLTPTSRRGTNFFAEHFETPLDSPITERWFENDALGIKGKIDLVHAPDRLVDYKSGNKKSDRTIVKRSAIDPPAEIQNYQALLYLTHFRTVHPDAPLEFTFVHFLEPLDDVITGEADLEDALTTVTYYPYTFDEYVHSREAYDELCGHYNDCQATFEELGFPAYSDIMRQRTFPETTDRDDLRASTFADSFTSAVRTATSDTVDAAKGCDQAIRKLNSIRQRTYFKDDLDAFEGFIEERLAELNDRRRGEERFPVAGIGGEPNYRRVDNRDLLLEGGRDG